MTPWMKVRITRQHIPLPYLYSISGYRWYKAM
nr:MAG TPA: hypothetical protein [Caudoviricetes sp.]